MECTYAEVNNNVLLILTVIEDVLYSGLVCGESSMP